MSGHDFEPRATASGRDPVLRFLAGCGIVFAVLAAVVLVSGLLVGWRLARDETPDRAPERFLVGDETRYWCLDLKPDDAGLAALFARLDEINESTRRSLLRGTFLEALPLPHKRTRLDELAPITLEVALRTSDASPAGEVPRSWAARGTLSHGLFRARAALKVMRWALSRDATKGRTVDVDGIAVTEVRGAEAEFALATVGNRVLVTSDTPRMRAVLSSSAEPAMPALSRLLELHRQARLDGEDAWAFLSNAELLGLTTPLRIDGAAASFDINDHDELAFRIVLAPKAAIEEPTGFRGRREDCAVVVSALCPGIPGDAFVLDGESARPLDRALWECSGRIPDLSRRFGELLSRTTGVGLRERLHPSASPETPSATPSPPSPQQP